MTTKKVVKPFICVDIDLYDHPRVCRCSDPRAVLGLWTALTSYSRAHLLNGMVTKKWALALWADKTNAKHLAEMVREGLLEESGDDYVIQRYAPRNQTKEMVDDAREKARARMANVRANRGRTFAEHAGDVLNSTSILSVSVSPEGVQGEPAGVVKAPRNATDDGAFGLAVSAWAEGVKSVTDVPCMVAPGGAVQALVAAIVAHCPDAAKRVDWARDKGAAYAKYRKAARQPIKPHDFGDWLNSGELPSGVHRVAANGGFPKQSGGQWVEGDGK